MSALSSSPPKAPLTQEEARKLKRIDVINKVWARFDTIHDFGKINEDLTEKCMSIFDDNKFNELSITIIKKELETQFGTSQFGQKLVADVCKQLKPSKKYINAIKAVQAATTQQTKSSNILCTNLDIGYSNHKNRFFKRDDFEGKATCYLELLCNFDQNDDLVPQCWTQNIVPIIECGNLEGIKNTNPEINGCTIVLKGEVFNDIHGKEPKKKNETTSTLIKENISKCLISTIVSPTTNPKALAFIEDAHTHPFFLEDTERKCQNTRSWDSQSAGCKKSISQLDPAKTSRDAPEFEKVLYALQSINFDPVSGNVTLTRKANNGSATSTAFIQGEKYCKNSNTISSCDKFPRERHQLMDCIPQDGKGQNSCVTWITNTGGTYDANPAVYFDIKRSGDSFQALTAKYYVDEDRYPIFITMDKLACMKARMIGVTTILTHPKNNKSGEIAFTLFPSYQYKPHRPIAPRFERLKEVKQIKAQQDSSSKPASATRYEKRNKLKEQAKQAKDREERLRVRGRVKAEEAKKKATEEEKALEEEEEKALKNINATWSSFFTVKGLSTFSERFSNTFKTLKDFLLPSNFSNPILDSIFKKYFTPITRIGGWSGQQAGGDTLPNFTISTSSTLLKFYIDKYIKTTYVIETIFLTEHLKWFNRNGIASLDIYNDQTLNKYEFILDIPDWIEGSGKTPFSEDEYIQESIKSDYDNVIGTIKDLIEAYNKLIVAPLIAAPLGADQTRSLKPIIAQYLEDDIHKLCLDFYREKISLMAIEKISSKSDAGALQESLFAALTEQKEELDQIFSQAPNAQQNAVGPTGAFQELAGATSAQVVQGSTGATGPTTLTETDLLTHIPEGGTLELFDLDMQTSEEVAFNNVFFKYQNEHNLREFVRLKIGYAKQLKEWENIDKAMDGGTKKRKREDPEESDDDTESGETEVYDDVMTENPISHDPDPVDLAGLTIDSIIESKENREIDSALLLYVNLWIIDKAVKEDEGAQGGATYTKGASSRHPKKTAYPPFHPQTKTMLLHRFLKKKVAIV